MSAMQPMVGNGNLKNRTGATLSHLGTVYGGSRYTRRLLKDYVQRP